MAEQKVAAPQILQKVHAGWQAVWADALNVWSPYVRLHAPFFCLTPEEEERAGLQDCFAAIRLTDLSVLLSLPQVVKYKLEDFGLEIMAHEIGHHVYCPANLTDQGRMLARMRRALPLCENSAPLVANLYSDLLINDRLFRFHALPMDKVYLAIRTPNDDILWNFYLRIYEILWSLPAGTLVSMPLDEEVEGDAQLGNGVVRHYAGDWLKGAGRFAALCHTYLLKQKLSCLSQQLTIWMDTQQLGAGSDELPAGLTEMDADEISGAVHPALESTDKEGDQKVPEVQEQAAARQGGNYRQPFEYGQILADMGINIPPREMAIRYYRERAIPYLIPFPVERQPASSDPLPEGLEVWEVGESLEKLDWLESALRSPVIIPGYTTLQRVYGTSPGGEPEIEPIDLDLYVDCSGSMPEPTHEVSYLTLAAAIISISALRAGARVQASLWSGTDECLSTPGFIRDEHKILEAMTGYFGDGTAFPIHKLRTTYSGRKVTERKVHILVISDDGVTTMFDKDERGNPGDAIAAMALEKARGGGTFVLNLYSSWKQDKQLVKAAKMGWDIYSIKGWEDLLNFSRQFTRKHYTQEKEITG